MSITDELREWINGNTIIHVTGLRAIADRIDERHKHAVMSAMNDALYHANDESMAELGWLRLPKDADGAPIHVGDVMEWPTTGETFEVVGISANTLFYIEHDFDDSAQWTAAYDKRHHHEPTVEDVLQEFAEKMNENMGMYTGEAIDADEWRDADRQTIAEYAAKLRLAGEAE